MSESQIDPISVPELIEILDVLLGLAIGSILIGNMQWFSGYGMMPSDLAGQGPLIDRRPASMAQFTFRHFRRGPETEIRL